MLDIIIPVRKLLNYTVDDLTGILTGAFKIRFEDGSVLETNYREVIGTRLLWKALDVFPNIIILPKHFISSHYSGGYYGKDTHIKVLNAVRWSIVDAYNLSTDEELDSVLKLDYEATNEYYNDMIDRTYRYITTLSASDFSEIVESKEMKKIMENIVETPDSVNMAIKDINSLLHDSKSSLAHNNIISATISGIVNDIQMVQCVGILGYGTEVDEAIFKKPVLKNFANGLTDIYSKILDSRSAARALFYAESALQDSEYFARLLQLSLMSLGSVDKTYECTPTEYFVWPEVRAEIKNDAGIIVQKCDLGNLQGKYYLDETDNSFKMVNVDSTELIGKQLKIRSAIFCNHPDKYKICSKCIGGLADSMYTNDNLGHLCSINPTKKNTQQTLGAKHLTSSSNDDIIRLPTEIKEFLVVRSDNEIYVGKRFSKNTKIIVGPESINGITGLKTFNMNTVNTSRISQVNSLTICDHTGMGVLKLPVDLYITKRVPHFTIEFLQYIQTYSWNITDDGLFEFTLDKWDPKLPILKYSPVALNNSMHSDSIKKIIKASKQTSAMSVRKTKDHPATVVSNLYEKMNSKLDVNLALLEVIVYGISSPDDPNNGDLIRHYNLNETSVDAMHQTLAKRSVSNLLAVERQSMTLTTIGAHLNKHRVNHPMDTIFNPQDCVKDHLNRKQ